MDHRWTQETTVDSQITTLSASKRFFVGTVLPCVLLFLVLYGRMGLIPHEAGEAGGWHVYGLFLIAIIVPCVALVLNLWVMFVKWRTARVAFFAGCVVPIVLLIVQLATEK